MQTALKLSADRKTAYGITASGKGVNVPNTFGMTAGNGAGGTCPGATRTCQAVCYAGRLEGAYTGVRQVVAENTRLIMDADTDEKVRLLDEMLTTFELACDKRGTPKHFRWQWDGDVPDASYARALAAVMALHPTVTFWMYTRSLRLVPHLARVPNLHLYLSADADNYRAVTNVLRAFPHLKVATMGRTFDAALQIGQEVRGTTRRIARCPEQTGAVALMGACASCGLCSNGRADVLFSTTNK